MDRTREGTGYGINPLQPMQIEAWARLRHIILSPWQLDAIERMDATRMRVYFEKSNSKETGGEADQISAQPLTPKSMAYIFPGKRKRFSRDGTLLN